MPELDDKIEIFTSGHPRSGNTWLNRLLSDLLSSPMQTLPGAVIEYFGKKRDGKYVIRKTHYTVDKYSGRGFFGSCKMIYIQRDPRDVAISAMYYRKIEPSLMKTIESMCGYRVSDHELRKPYLEFVEPWYDQKAFDVETRYERLHFDPINELRRIVRIATGIMLDDDWIYECYNRQLFSKWKDKYPHSMRLGQAGDWSHHFSREHGRYMNECMGEFMVRMEYVDNLNWWEDLPETSATKML